MNISDQDFREEFKPIKIPSSYSSADSPKDRIIFALAILGEANAQEVFEKIREYEPDPAGIDILFVKKHLFSLYENGLIKGKVEEKEIRYNLSKITDGNKGFIDPDLLSPGLD